MSEATAIVMMGVSGSGKTTIGRLLAARIRAEFVDADDLHSAANTAKMSAGVPLTDEDRLPWLRLTGELLGGYREAGRRAVIACSALRRSYRDVLREEAGGPIFFIQLAGSESVLGSRLAARQGHFMPPGLLGSQLSTLEPLGSGEVGLRVEIAGTPNEIVERVVRGL